MGGAAHPSATISGASFCGDRAIGVGFEEGTTPKWQGKMQSINVAHWN
jgi:hypothetical protein